MRSFQPPPAFLFVLAQPESKQLLCDELGREHPELHLAYSRPGLYTFKHAKGYFEPGFELRSVFARHHGFSLGRAEDGAAVAALLDPSEALQARSTDSVHAKPTRATASSKAPKVIVQVIARDAGERRPRASSDRIAQARDAILRASDHFDAAAFPESGDWVIDVVLPPDDAHEEPWFVGYHYHVGNRSSTPGSVIRKEPPPNAPSRAWAKLEEVLEWSSLPMRSGDTAVEIGCAPGGAVLSMINRGLHVIGVDPGAVDPQIALHAKTIGATFQHLQAPCAALTRDQLPPKVDWLLSDANLAPQVAIRYLAHWTKMLRPHLCGLIFTMKLNDQRAVDSIQKLLPRVAEFGLGRPRAVQLPSHRREIAIVAFRGRRGR